MRKALGGIILVIAALVAAFVVHVMRLSHTLTVTGVINATSIQCDGGRIFKLIGLAEPADASADEEGRLYLRRFVLDKRVRIVEAQSSHPGTAYVYCGVVLVNGRMIKDGFGQADMQDDYPERELFMAYEKEARARGLGIWKVFPARG